MAHGGARSGAGRKPGAKNKSTVEREVVQAEAVAEAKQSGVSPLEVMLGAMRKAWQNEDNDAAARFAKDAAPYVHPRLQAVEHTGRDGKDLIPDKAISNFELARFMAFVLQQAADDPTHQRSNGADH